MPTLDYVLRKGWSGEGQFHLDSGLLFFRSQGGEEELRGGCPGDCCGHVTRQYTMERLTMRSAQGLGKSSSLRTGADSWQGFVFCPCLGPNKLPFPLITLHAVAQLPIFKEMEQLPLLSWLPLLGGGLVA